MSQDKNTNQGEGDRASARRYDREVREFVAEGKVPDAADKARDYVDRQPVEAARAERRARRGPMHRWVSVDEIIAKGQSVFARMKGVAANLRKRLAKEHK